MSLVKLAGGCVALGSCDANTCPESDDISTQDFAGTDTVGTTGGNDGRLF